MQPQFYVVCKGKAKPVTADKAIIINNSIVSSSAVIAYARSEEEAVKLAELHAHEKIPENNKVTDKGTVFCLLYDWHHGVLNDPKE